MKITATTSVLVVTAALTSAALTLAAGAGTAAAAAKRATPAATTAATPASKDPFALPGGHAVTMKATVDLSTMTSPAEQCVASGPLAKGVCVRSGLLSFSVTGDISGPAVWASSSWAIPPDRGGGFGGVWTMENASVAGCGTGTITLSAGPAPLGWKVAAPSGTQGFPGYWQIVSRSNSSKLATMQGQGLIWGDSFGPGPVTFTAIGSVTC